MATTPHPFPPGAVVHSALEASSFTHLIGIPDSSIGTWFPLPQGSRFRLIRPCREGEAIGIALGLMLGGCRPLVFMQCTGLFEAGDALRNAVHDWRMPLKLIVGVRSAVAHATGRSDDSCPVFTEPILNAWRIPFRSADSADFTEGFAWLDRASAASALVLPE